MKPGYDSRSQQNKTTQDKWQKSRKDGLLSQTDVKFAAMDALENVFVGEVLYSLFIAMRMVIARNLMIALRNVHVLHLSCSNQLISHAFRPNVIVALFKSQWRLRTADFLLLGTFVLLPSSLFR